MWNRIILSLLLIVSCAKGMAATTISGRNLTTVDGLVSNQVHAIKQDDQGYIWFGTPNGLSRFDGYSFVNYHTVGYGVGKTNGNVGTIYINKDDGLMWIRTTSFNYACYDLRKNIFTDFTDTCDPQKTFKRFVTEDHGIWMFEDKTGCRHVTYQNGQFTCTDYTPESMGLTGTRIRRVMPDGQGGIWLITDNGLYRTDANGTLKTIEHEGHFLMGNKYNGLSFFLNRNRQVFVYDQQGKKIKETTIPSILGDTEGVNGNFVWQGKWMIMTRTAVITMDCQDYTFAKPTELQLEYGIVLDEMGDNHWISDKNTTLYLFPQTGTIRKFQLLRDTGFAIQSKRRFSTVLNADGNFYIATYGNGLYVYHPDTEEIEHYTADDQHPLLSTNFLTTIFADRNGCLWVSQEDAGVVCLFESRQPETEHYAPVPDQRGSLSNYIEKLSQEDHRKILLRTRSHQTYQFDVASNSFTHIGNIDIDNASIDSITDQKGRIWIATWEEGLIVRHQGKEEQFLTRNTSESRINALTIDKEQNLWIATYNGLYVVNTQQQSISNESFRHYGMGEGLPTNNIICLKAARDGHLWLGGDGTGVVKCTFGADGRLSISSVSSRQGLSGTTIHSLTEDNSGNIWAGTDDAIALIDTKTMRANVWQVGHTLLGNLNSDNCALTLADGRVLFGTHDGITIITPTDRQDSLSRTSTNAYITNIDVNVTSIYNETDDEEKDLHQAISFAHNENSLTFYFSCFDYAHLLQTMYQYYLEGIDQDWREPTTQHYAAYGNLPSGHYIFHIRTIEGNEETTLAVTIREPWYNTWWAWIAYLLLATAAGYYVYRSGRERFKLQQQMKVEKQVAEFRINFFTQVAHEFRTPLAIISGAVDKITQNEQSPRKPTQTAKRGIRRLTQLVNQLMEFRKVDTNNLRLAIEKGDIVDFIRNIYQDFWTSAQQKELSITFTPFEKKYETVFDRHILDTITYNLLSNAIKYTPQKGQIEVRLQKVDDQLLLTVEDSGPGIDAERESQLFKPFMHGYASQGGMGIGLYTAYKMALAHKGSLTYQHSGTLNGSKFTLAIPANDSLYKADEYNSLTAIETPQEKTGSTEIAIREMMPQALNNYRIAIIEDDPDMLEQIKTEVGVFFRVSGYTNGKAAIEGLHEDRAELVICDVMLPDINGYEIVKTIKAEADLKDVPVIMLTALDDERHQIKGYEAGADDYMTKPCNYHILLARIVQLIKWSLVATSTEPQPSTDNTPSSPDTPILTSQADKRFLDKVKTIIAQHISDPDYTIDLMAEQMKTGRTKLYGKVKELTGMSPNKLFNAERMRLAAELLEEGELNVSEVSYKVGILDTSYFNKCFKDHYGVTPSKYRKR